MLTDIQIKDLAKRMTVPLESVEFKDKLPKKLKTNKSYILNLQDSMDDNGNENGGTHWVLLQIKETPKGNVYPFYFDSYGAPPPEIVKKRVKENYKKYLPYSNKDIQSLMNNACGYYCLALAHYINVFKGRTGDFYTDIEHFLDMFDNLEESIDWKKNEYILKMFFQSTDKGKRKPVDVVSQSHDDYERIINKGSGGMDMMRLSVATNMNNKH